MMKPPHNKNNIEIIYSRLHKNFHGDKKLFIKEKLKTPDKDYSLIKFILGKGNRYRALISAGIHGDEPGGVETVCKFLENNCFNAFANEWELTFLPCLNPFGYEYGTRENHDDKDLNRLFKHNSPPFEVMFAMSVFDKYYDLTIELHEDFSTPGFYLYQNGTNDDCLGTSILQAVKNVMPLNLSLEIDGYEAKEGIINPKNDCESMDWWPMALYSLAKGTRRCLTLETATKYSMTKRVEAHLLAIDTALKFFSRDN